MNYYDMNTQEVLSQLDTSMNGLTGGEAKVPFQPKDDRPVYCSECFAKMKEEQA